MKYRKVSPAIWNDAKFRAFDDSAKLVFFLLLTHPAMTALGAMRATLQGLALELAWPLAKMKRAFAQVEACGMVRHYAEVGVMWLPNFLHYNGPESPNVVRAWQSALEALPEGLVRDEVVRHASEFAEGLQEAFSKAFREALRQAFPKASGKTLQELVGHPSLNPEPEPEPEPLSPLAPHNGNGKAKRRRQRLPARPCPESFDVDERMSTWAQEKGLAAERVMLETERFLGHHRAKGSVFADWNQAWCNWIDKAVEFKYSRRAA